MANPDFTRIFGSIGLNATITTNDYNTGWENIAGSQPPTKSEFNSIDGEQDTKLAYLDKRARDEWSATIDYVVNDIALGVDGKRYIAITNNTGLEPSANPNYWGLPPINGETLRYTRSFNLPIGTDLNLVDGINYPSGFYDIDATTSNNTPFVGWIYLEVQMHSNADGYCKQIATELNDTTAHQWIRTKNAGVWGSWYKVWNANNDGSGSGLDSDLLDGYDSTYFLPANKYASETVAGISEAATQNETDIGADDSRFVTPKKLKWGASFLMASNGYIVFPSWLGGLIIQWGVEPGSGTFAFPIVFPNQVFCGVANDSDSIPAVPSFYNVTNSSFSLPSDVNYWIAFGH